MRSPRRTGTKQFKGRGRSSLVERRLAVQGGRSRFDARRLHVNDPRETTVPTQEDVDTADDDADFAQEHNRLWVESDHGETESPKGHGGLEATKRPN